MSGRILVVEDDPDLGELLRDRLSRRGFEVCTQLQPEAALERLAAEDFDAVVTDVRLRRSDGIALCADVTASRSDVPVIVITAFGSLETAVAALRAGAFDFLPKPFEIEELAFRLDRALAHRHLGAELRRLRVDSRPPVEGLIGQSPAMQRLRDLVARVACSDAPVLITGETGTGKELVARAVHRHGVTPGGPFVALNCAAVPGPLLESELFGHERGAFTDARTSRTGLLLEARGGTLFLDEIAELPLTLQPKLLRALQERRVRPLGAAGEVPCDARVVAATNRDLDLAVAEGGFRKDLFFRLDVLRIDVPPLRERGNDVLLLAQSFLRAAAGRHGRAVEGLSRGAAEKLLDYPWPGNVRELENTLERAVALARHDQVLVEDLPERIREHRRAGPPAVGEDPSELVSLEVVEQRYVVRVLEAVGGNKTLAARILGLDRKTLYRKLDRISGR